MTHVYSPNNDTWRYGPSLPKTVSTAAVAVVEGKIWLFGGSSGYPNYVFSNTTMCYDPVKGQWSYGPDLPEPIRTAAAAVHLGKVYIIGGQNSTWGTVQNAIIFDPTTQKFTAMEGPNSPRARGGIAVINDTLVFAGGVNTTSDAMGMAEVYDFPPSGPTSTGLITLKSDKPSYAPEENVTLTANVQRFEWKWERIADGPNNGYLSAVGWDEQTQEMYIFGGYIGGSSGLTSTWAFSPSANKWTMKMDAPAGRYGHAAIWVPNTNCFYIFGGHDGTSTQNTLWAYYPSNDTWITKSTGPSARNHMSLIWDPDMNAVIMYGGNQTCIPGQLRTR